MTEHEASRSSRFGVPFRHCALVLVLLMAAFAGAADLFDAVQRGDVKLVRHILDDPTPPVHARDDDGRTALHAAADAGSLPIATVLLDAGADVLARDDDGLTPLHCAARQGATALVQLLLARKAELNARDDQGWTPLLWAVALRNLDTAQLLLARGAIAGSRDAMGITPLHWAAANGQRAALELLLGKGAGVNAADDEGNTPLHWAAAGGQTATVQWLLDNGASPVSRDRQGRTPLMIADEMGQTTIAGLLRPAEQAALKLPGLTTPDLATFVAPDTLTAPADDAVGRTPQPAKLTATSNPLATRATTLYTANGQLYLGLANGGVLLCNPAKPDAGTAVAPPVPAAGTRAITTGGGAVWWLTARPALLCAYRPDARTVTAYAVGALRPGSPLGAEANDAPTLTWWKGRLVVSLHAGTYALDARTGELRGLLGLLPPQIAGAARGARLFLAAERETAVLTAVRPQDGGWRVTTWRSSGAAWTSAGAQTAPQWCGVAAVSPQRLALVGASRITDVPAATGVTGALPYLTYAARVPVPRWAAAGGDTVWWGGGDVLYHAVPDRAEVYAYLPWNDPGVTVAAAAADDAGVWLATNRGVRRLTPGAPGTLGYAGFVRLRLGSEAEEPLTDTDRRIAAAVEAWQGTPYAWGGASRRGTDCSGFVMAMHQAGGVAIPHGSANLRVCPYGDIVRDELRYGDVLVYPGHAALYIGNGRTAETVTGAGVGKSTLWTRRTAVVRRFLNIPLRSNVQLASRSGNRATAAARKKATTTKKR